MGLAALDKRQQYFLDLLTDPSRKHSSISTIAKAAKVTPSQVIDLYRNASFAQAHAIASSCLQTALPAVVQDIAEKSVDAKIECPTCFGSGQSGGTPCLNCDGRGEIFRASDLDRQKLVLEATGVVKRGQPGLNVNVNQQVGIVQPGSFFSKWVKNSDQAAYDVKAIDAESENDQS